MALSSGVTQLLCAWRQGDPDALDQLLPLVYDELHRLAHQRMLGEWAGGTIQTTALVHEAYVRLVDGAGVSWDNRAHFFAVCARLMRRILVDRARARHAAKRGAEVRHVPYQDWLGATPLRDDASLLDLDDALSRLAAIDSRRSRVVELRYFGGLSIQETAAVLGISPETVGRDWQVARLWLRHELRREAAEDPT